MTDKVKIGLEEISLLVSGVKEEKRARDFLDELLCCSYSKTQKDTVNISKLKPILRKIESSIKP